MKRQHVKKPMPIVAMVGLCFSFLAFVLTVVASSSMSFGASLAGFVLTLSAISVFASVLGAWVRA